MSLPDLDHPDRFLDVALLCTWADGGRMIVLVEHWSEVRKVEEDRVLLYYAALRLLHRGTEVIPVLLVTDRSPLAVPERWESRPLGMAVLDFRMRVKRYGPRDLPRLRALPSRVAAVLMALAMEGDAVEIVVAALVAMRRTPGPLDDLQRFLPLAMKLARMKPEDEPRLFRRLREEPAAWPWARSRRSAVWSPEAA